LQVAQVVGKTILVLAQAVVVQVVIEILFLAKLRVVAH
jgi:hypothetical protein